MKNKLIVLLIISLISLGVNAQTVKSQSFEFSLNSELAFEKIIDFAIHQGFFIANLDKSSGFMQVIEISDRKKNLVSIGQRITYNILIRKNEGSRSILLVQLKVEDHMYKNYVGYYVDKVLIDDDSYFTPIITQLKSTLGL